MNTNSIFIDEVLSRTDYPGKAPTPGPTFSDLESQNISSPPLSSQYLNSDYFSLSKVKILFQIIFPNYYHKC